MGGVRGRFARRSLAGMRMVAPAFLSRAMGRIRFLAGSREVIEAMSGFAGWWWGFEASLALRLVVLASSGRRQPAVLEGL